MVKTKAIMLEPVGRYVTGETVIGTVADVMIANGTAMDVTPKPPLAKPKVKKAFLKKALGAAPENKSEG
jgi:hypothetical protein|tara:strand:- start:722 stop:928 length:207 start_codon:yes stop_codon:yes gene_type:complete